MSTPDRIYVPQDALDKCNLPAEAKRFLHDSGLPWFLGPSEADVWTVFRDQDILEPFKFHKKRYYILGDDEYDGKTCIQEHTGEVVVIAEMDDVPVRFLNSNVEKMVLFSELWRGVMHPDRMRRKRADRRAALATVRLQMQQSDPTALADEETCWSIVLDDADYELDD